MHAPVTGTLSHHQHHIDQDMCIQQLHTCPALTRVFQGHELVKALNQVLKDSQKVMDINNRMFVSTKEHTRI